MNIKPRDIVLEVGSGNNPNPRSDILVDRYPFDNGQRAGGFRIVVDRPMVVADGYRLPFKDKTFDYVICSHILEHMEDPKGFLMEVARVAKAGYIEVPSAVSERVFGWNFHHWYCEKKGNTLVLQRKKEGEQFDGFFHRLIADQIWFRRFFEEHEGMFYVRYEWRDRPLIRVDDREPSKTALDTLDKMAWSLLKRAKPQGIEDSMFYISWMKRRIIRKVKKITRLFFWSIQRVPLNGNIVERIVACLTCPICGSGKLVRSNGKITCGKCTAVFPIVGVIPVMLTPVEQKKGY